MKDQNTSHQAVYMLGAGINGGNIIEVCIPLNGFEFQIMKSEFLCNWK